MKTIGGSLDYRLLATKHRPVDPVALAQEVRRLRESGLMARDIGAALGMSWEAVEQILRDEPRRANA